VKPEHCGQILSTTAFLIEVAVIYARDNPSSHLSKNILSLLIFKRLSSADTLRISSDIRITRSFVVGSALTIIGGLMRLSCYRTLGRLFTYEISILKGHTLVTTGLYGIVRHPSYLSFCFGIPGLCLCLMTRGSWLVESGALSTWIGRSVVGSWHLWTWYLGSMISSRVRMEDEYLRKEFGQQWIEWQKKVPYKLFPGIF